jgi:two-component system, OmpR family, sensor kinase
VRPLAGGWPAGLRWRLSRGSVGVLLVLLIGVGAFQYVALRQFLLSEQAGELGAQARYAIAAAGGTSRAAADPDTLASAASGPTSRAAVYDSDGHRLALAPPGPAGLNGIEPSFAELGVDRGRLTPGTYYQVLGTGTRQLLGVAAAVGPYWAPRRLVVIESLLTGTYTTLRGDVVIYSIGGGAALLAGALLTAVLTSRALLDLRRVARTATAVAGGDLDRRADIEGRDEVAALGAAFDEMVEQLQGEMTRRRAAEDAMRRFLADTSHELRTPIAVLRGNLDVLRRGSASNREDLAASLEDMHSMTVRMSRLVEDLLLLARLDQGQRLVLVDLELPAVLAATTREGARIAPDHPVELGRTDPLTVRSDADALGRVLLNLVDNAARYSPAGTPITLRGVDTGAGTARLEVTDRGPGIPADEQGRIFERFHRGPAAAGTSPRRGGSGLGLSISAAIVQQLDASISVRSRPGEGSTFVVEVPLAPPGDAPARRDSRTPP